MNDQLNKKTSSNNASGNDDASHEGVKMEGAFDQKANDTESAEVSGTPSNDNLESLPVEPSTSQAIDNQTGLIAPQTKKPEGGSMEKKELTPLQKHTRKCYGIPNITDARTLQGLRKDNRQFQTEINSQIEQMEARIESIEDELDRLALKDEINDAKDQIKNLDRIYDKISSRVTELLKNQ